MVDNLVNIQSPVTKLQMRCYPLCSACSYLVGIREAFLQYEVARKWRMVGVCGGFKLVATTEYIGRCNSLLPVLAVLGSRAIKRVNPHNVTRLHYRSLSHFPPLRQRSH